MSRRLLLSVAGLGLLSAAGCATAVPSPGDLAAHAGGGGPTPGTPSGRAGTPTPSPSPTGPGTAAAASAPPRPSATPSTRTVGAVNVPSPSLSPAAPQPRRVGSPLFSLPSHDRLVALTIDDGPDPANTPVVLSILQQYGIRATFFLIGENAARQPALVREIADHGHHIANHTWTHPDLRGLSETTVRDELQRTCDLLHTATGRAPTWFRAPGGDWSDVSLRVGAELGMRPMGWSVDPQDWARPGTSAITTRVLQAVGPGSIVLNHDGGGDRSQTIAALRMYLPVLIDEGYRFTAPPQ
ncbi:polysaccharide deacetylase family protein [Kitasatospora sp. NPDC059571]|uniref:polysaccharide deacetylase family protein n=1 Tax=Kitasatospora sp. NPDC059571 TaxID=3346871 RepID=UPI0036A82212